MQTILPDRIISDGVVDGKIAVPFYAWGKDDFESGYEDLVAGLTEEEELTRVSSIISSGNVLHIDGVSLSSICDEVRKSYESCGYFRAEINRFEPDYTTAPVTLGCYFENLFSERNGFLQRHTGHQKALRKALNSGVISTLSFRCNDEVYLQKAVIRLLSSEEFSPFRLARILCYNKEYIIARKKERNAAPFRKWIIVDIPKSSEEF